jgi:hypothetical protein
MAAFAHQEARPRTTGEILDDAWRLYRGDAPLLLAASGLFVVPAAIALIVLLTEPFAMPAGLRFLWPALAAVLLPLTGLGAGACEEAFHLWTEDRPVTLGGCLRPAWQRGVSHCALQALVLLLPMVAVLCLASRDMHAALRWVLALLFLALNLPVWMLGLTRHAVLTAGQKNVWRAWRLARRASGRHPGKAFLLVVIRLVILLLAVLNLHLLLRVGLSIGEELAGLNTAYLRVLCSLGNPIYLVVLAALVWWLLAPYNEAVNYLFLVDARTRYEGLDLWYQIEQFFPLPRAAKVGAVLLAVGVLMAGGPARAQPVQAPPRAAERLPAVQEARKELQAILREVKTAEPYPGGRHWLEPLREVGHGLDPDGDQGHGRYRWFFQAVDRLGHGGRAADLKILSDLDSRLSVVEESLRWQPPDQTRGARGPSAADIRRLVPPGSDDAPRKQVEKKKPEKKPPPVENDRVEIRRVSAPSAGVGDAVGGLFQGLGYFCVFVFAALLAAVIVVGVALLVRSWQRNRPKAQAGEQGANELALEDVLNEPDRQNVAGLWRQSDELARAGRFLEAVRTLYLAVLALLHQASLIRYERTRTNGEYADQLRRKAVPVHRPFLGLTGLFEVKWYGERACQAGDYQTCRGLAETIQAGVREGAAGA